MDYVSLVKIKQQLPFEYKEGATIEYQVLIEEIKRFKGVQADKIKIYGAPPKSEVWTSCDVRVSEGEEWLIISSLGPDGVPMISFCGRSMLYRAADGFRDWQYQTAMKTLDLISESFQISELPEFVKSNEPVIFFKNGQVERTMQYKNGKKDGITMYYYPDGVMYGRSEYKKDSLNGKSNWYDRNGKISTKASFKMGLPVDTMVHYMYPDVPFIVNIYSKKGIIQKSQLYQGHFEKRNSSHLSSETTYKAGLQASTKYFSNKGKLQTILYIHTEGKTEEKYDESGNLLERRHFDTQGNLIKMK